MGQLNTIRQRRGLRLAAIVLGLGLGSAGILLGQSRGPRGGAGGLSAPGAGGAPPVPASIAAAKPAQMNLTFDEQPLDRAHPRRITSYADVVEKVTPAVVSVYPVVKVRVPESLGEQQLVQLMRFIITPSTPARGGRGGATRFPEFTGPLVEKTIPYGVGSGSIVTADGYVITNHHVVTGPEEQLPGPVTARLPDGREIQATLGLHVRLTDGREFDARLVGSDENTDIALLKIEARNLPYITLADSAQLKVGDIVFAVGNPMDVGLTVTQGIVSATQRTDLRLMRDGAGFENFIQTDASINPGNSGGPLVDAEGRQVGISSAILSTTRSGGNIGIGFAIPSSLARDIITSLSGQGVIKRGLLGVMPTDIDYDTARRLGLPTTKGALLESVSAGQPGALAGLEKGDVVLQVDGEEIDSASELRFVVASRPPGAKIAVKIQRGTEQRTLSVTLGDRDLIAAADINPGGTPAQPNIPMLQPPVMIVPSPAPVPAPQPPVLSQSVPPATTPTPAAVPPALPAANAEAMLGGVTLEPVTAVLRERYKLPAEAVGLVVTGVAATSPSIEQFAPGMVVLEINKAPVRSLDDVKAQLKPGAVNIVRVLRDGHSAFLSVIPPEK